MKKYHRLPITNGRDVDIGVNIILLHRIIRLLADLSVINKKSISDYDIYNCADHLTALTAVDYSDFINEYE